MRNKCPSEQVEPLLGEAKEFITAIRAYLNDNGRV